MRDLIYVKIRPFHWDDLYSLVNVINMAEITDGITDLKTLDSLYAELTAPDVVPERDCMVATNSFGRLLGYSKFRLGIRSGRAWADGAVHPHYRENGIGYWLIQASDFQLKRRQDEVFYGDSVYVQRDMLEVSDKGCALLDRSGYHVVRYILRLSIALDSDLPSPRDVNGFHLVQLDTKKHAKEAFATQQASYAHQWEAPQLSYSAWESYYLNADDAIWWLVVDKTINKVAGVVMGRPLSEEQPEIGFVDVLGIRPEYRGQGLGVALLSQCLQAFVERGMLSAQIEYDTESATEIPSFLTTVGFELDRRYLIYRKVLREAVT